MAFSLKKLKVKDPYKYNRVGSALEEFICKQTLQSKICEKYNLGNNFFAACIEAYLGTPGERLIIQFELHDEEAETENPELELFQTQTQSQSQSQTQLA
jgi:hypothetical protein